MRHTRTALITTTAALLLTTTLNGCSDAGQKAEPEPSSPTVTDTPSQTPAATPTPQTPEELAIADATAALDRYFDTMNEMALDDSIPLKELKKVAISTGLFGAELEIESVRSKKATMTGDETYDSLKVLRVLLSTKDGNVPSVEVQVCRDLSQVQGVDEDGKSVVSPSRLDRSVATFGMSNYTYAKDPRSNWKVSVVTSPMAKEC